MRSPMAERWQEPHLIQRLKAPFDQPRLEWSAFGGGLKNGGLSDDAKKLVDGFFRFDYMGAAEYEFGAVPEALDFIAKNAKDYVPGIVGVNPKKLDAPWWVKDAIRDWKERQAAEKAWQAELPAEVAVYYFCHQNHEEEVRAFLKKLALGEARVRDFPSLECALFPDPAETRTWDRRVGGLELNNGWFWFADEGIWENVCTLFDPERPADLPCGD